jgi:hypothetical protein
MSQPHHKAVHLSKACRLFFGGQAISLVGTWITQTAVLWLVYQLTDSAIYLGLITFLAYRREAPRSTASVSVGMKAERIDDCSRAT